MNPADWFIALLSLSLIVSVTHFSLRIKNIKKRYRNRINDMRSTKLSHEELHGEITSLKAQIALKEEKIHFKDQFIDSLKEEIKATNRKSQQLEEALALKDKQVEDLNGSVKELEVRIRKMKSNFKNRLSTMNSTEENSLSERDEIIQKLQDELSSCDDIMVQLKKEIIEARKIIREKEAHFEEVLTDASHKEQSLEETLSQLNSHEETIEKLQKDIVSTQKTAGEFSRQIDHLNDLLENKETESLNIRKGLNSWIAKVKELKLELKSKESENILLLSQLKAKERELDKLRHEDKSSSKPEANIKRGRTPYEILGVSEGATFDEVKAAHRKAAKQYNPHIVETLGDDVRELVVETSKEINLAFAWFKKKFNRS